MQMPYRYVITDSNYSDIATIPEAHRRSYSKFLNNIGQAYFEVYLDNPLVKSLNIDPLTKMYGLKIYRGTNTTPNWQGMIDGLTPSDKYKNSMNVVGFQASSRLADLGDVLITTDSETPQQRSGLKDKKIGTEVIQVLFNECKAKSNSPIGDMLSSITDVLDEKNVINTMQEQDTIAISSLLDIVVFLADVTNSDFYVDDATKTFYFKDKVGVESTVQYRFVENQAGNNIKDFSIQMNMRDVNNHPVGFCTGEAANMKMVSDVYDSASLNAYKLRERLSDLRSLDSEASVRTQINKNLQMYGKPRYFSSIALSNSIDLFNGWTLGDTVEIWIKRGFINFRERKRIMGVTVDIDAQNMENISLNYIDPVTN